MGRKRKNDIQGLSQLIDSHNSPKEASWVGNNRPHAVSTYSEVKARIDEAKEILCAKRVALHGESALGKVFRSASKLASDWERDEIGIEAGDLTNLIVLSHADRVAEAIIECRNDPAAEELIRRIAGKPIGPLVEGPSQGKDALWELELLVFLRRRGLSAALAEPDIVLTLPEGPVGIACKNVNSERGAEAQVGKGVRQLKMHDLSGIVALRIDSLIPLGPKAILRTQSYETGSDFLDKFNLNFIDRHRSAFQRYVAEGRCDGILVSTTTPAHVLTSSTSFNNFAQHALWTVEKKSLASQERIAALGRALNVDTVQRRS